VDTIDERGSRGCILERADREEKQSEQMKKDLECEGGGRL